VPVLIDDVQQVAQPSGVILPAALPPEFPGIAAAPGACREGQNVERQVLIIKDAFRTSAATADARAFDPLIDPE
jgi:hypothetical protein